MAGDDKKSAPKGAAKEKAAPKEKAEAAVKTEAKADTKTDAKPEASAPSNYSRGEGQKVVTQAYKDNWDAIFGKKRKKKSKKKRR